MAEGTRMDLAMGSAAASLLDGSDAVAVELQLATLTPRQREVLSLLARNWSAKRIARHLTVGVSAVKATVSRIRKKLGVAEPASMAAAALAYELFGRIDLDPRVLRYLFLGAPMAIALFRGPGHVVELINDEGQRLAGGQDLRGKPIREAFPQLEADRYIDLLDDAYEAGTRYAGRALAIRFGHGDCAREHLVDVVLEPTRDASGAVDGLVAFVAEVTASVHAQQRKEGTEAYRFPILEQVSDGVLVFGRDGTLSFANPAARGVLGQRVADQATLGALLAEWRVRRAGSGAPVDMSNSSVLAALRGVGPTEDDYLLRHPDTGEQLVVHGTTVPLRLKEGRVHSAAFIFRVTGAASAEVREAS